MQSVIDDPQLFYTITKPSKKTLEIKPKTFSIVAPCHENSSSGDRLYLMLLGKAEPMLDGNHICPGSDLTPADRLIRRAEGRLWRMKQLADDALAILENKKDELFIQRINKDILEDIFFMINFSPCSDPNRAVEVLYEIFKTKELKDYPSKGNDVCRMSLHSMTTQVEYATEVPVDLKEDLIKEIKDPNYALEAFDVLFAISKEDALNHLPEVLKVLENDTQRKENLIFNLIPKGRKNPELILRINEIAQAGGINNINF